jgi:probable addiction module antidote protein
MAKLAPFDAVDYLDDDEIIAEYLSAALEDPNPDVFLAAVRDVARARGMAQLAKDAGLWSVKASTRRLRPVPNHATTPCSS